MNKFVQVSIDCDISLSLSHFFTKKNVKIFYINKETIKET